MGIFNYTVPADDEIGQNWAPGVDGDDRVAAAAEGRRAARADRSGGDATVRTAGTCPLGLIGWRLPIL